MFCGYCGRPIPDDTTFCEYCGKTLAVVRNYDRAQLKAARVEIFTREWKRFVRSPLVLITMIFMCAYLIFSAYNSIVLAPEIKRQLSSYMNDNLVSIYMVIVFASYAVEILQLVGISWIYLDAVRNPNARPASNGLLLIRASMRVSVLLVIAGLLLAVLPALQSLNNFGRYDAVLIFILLITVAVLGVFYWVALSILKKAIQNVDFCETDSSMLCGFGVVTIVMGGISALGLLANFTLESICSVVLEILFGCVMLSCRKTLKWIAWQQHRLTQ